MMLRRSLSRLHPARWKASWNAARTLWFEYGHLHSVATQTSVDADGPVPWYTYPAIAYLKQLDFSDATVFEYGSGNSTLFWARVAKRVISVDDDPSWYQVGLSRLPSNCELVLETDLARYPGVIARFSQLFDVIVVDGAARARTRLRCARAALPWLRDGGMIILDNSDWLPESARVLRDSGLIEVDMTGFTPIAGHTQTTSLFLHRAFAFRPAGARQPIPGPGAKNNIWEHPVYAEPPLVECDGEVFGGVTRDQIFDVISPAGARTFRFVVAEAPPNGLRTAAILDMQAGRVVLSLTERMHATRWIEEELEALTCTSWPAFSAYLNSHDKRRCDIAADGTVARKDVAGFHQALIDGA